jgi:hypothetical protein
MAGKNMLSVPDMQQGPKLIVPAKNDIPAATTIASVGAAFGYKFFPPQMDRSFASAT